MDQVNEDKNLGSAAVDRKTGQGVWQYVETPLAAEVRAGDIVLRPHWKGTQAPEDIRAVLRMASAAPALYDALRKCQTYVEHHTHEKRGIYGSLLDAIDAALALADKGPASQTDSE